MRPKYMAGPISSLLNAKFIPHMGNRVPCAFNGPFSFKGMAD